VNSLPEKVGPRSTFPVAVKSVNVATAGVVAPIVVPSISPPPILTLSDVKFTTDRLFNEVIEKF
jgi:hypothetical protein